MARFYVVTSTYSAGCPLRAEAGPFASREAAEAEAAKYPASRDIRIARQALVFSRTALVARGYPRTERGEYDLERDIDDHNRENNER